MPNPILVTLSRGHLVESFHRGAIALAGANGNLIIGMGDVSRPVFPRSAIKVLQALPLVESGAADAAGFDNRELALACASHSGEPVHARTAGRMLEKVGLTPDALACGPQWPLESGVARSLARTGKDPTVLHNNCSGKHAGMLALTQHLGFDVNGYEKPDHPVQNRIRKTLEDLTGEKLTGDVCGIDGCSVPTWAVSLTGYARAFAKLANKEQLKGERRHAADRLMRACASEPQMVEGEGRFGTDVMRQLGTAAFVKGGAEGVYCAAFPEQGLGLALKIDDGARRGAEATAAFVIARVLADRIKDASELTDLKIRNWRGTHVGDIAASDELSRNLENLCA